MKPKQSPKHGVITPSSSENDEFDKIENSLKEFISVIIHYFDKFGIHESVLVKYEELITTSSTLLEVFEVIKAMFEELMGSIQKQSL